MSGSRTKFVPCDACAATGEDPLAEGFPCGRCDGWGEMLVEVDP